MAEGRVRGGGSCGRVSACARPTRAWRQPHAPWPDFASARCCTPLHSCAPRCTTPTPPPVPPLQLSTSRPTTHHCRPWPPIHQPRNQAGNLSQSRMARPRQCATISNRGAARRPSRSPSPAAPWPATPTGSGRPTTRTTTWSSPARQPVSLRAKTHSRDTAAHPAQLQDMNTSGQSTRMHCPNVPPCLTVLLAARGPIPSPCLTRYAHHPQQSTAGALTGTSIGRH